jgi:LysM repeat protein
LDLFVSADHGSAEIDNLRTALEQLQKYLADSIHCETKFLVAYSQHAVVAVYSGAAIDNSQTIPSVMQQLMEQVGAGHAPSSMTLQLCGEDRNADYTFGVADDTTGDLAAVQKAVRAWSDGTCVNSTQAANMLEGVSVYEAPLVSVTEGAGGNGTTANGTVIRARHPLQLQARADCTTVTVVSGDSCGSLASKCGISGADFTKYNPAPNLCSALTVGERVCCSSGTLPDITPKKNVNGSCATYTVQSGDYCSLIAASNGLTVTQVEGFNDNTTWGWNGCNDLFAGINICLSEGTPPLPAPVSNALCGPTVPGTTYPNASQTMADLNPCPLNTCCDVWGQCGMTPEYCTIDLGPTGNPGTAPTGKNGCVSNCGTTIKNK